MLCFIQLKSPSLNEQDARFRVHGAELTTKETTNISKVSGNFQEFPDFETSFGDFCCRFEFLRDSDDDVIRLRFILTSSMSTEDFGSVVLWVVFYRYYFMGSIAAIKYCNVNYLSSIKMLLQSSCCN